MLIEQRLSFSVIGKPDQSLTYQNREDTFANAFSQRTLYQSEHLIEGDLGQIALYKSEFDYLLTFFNAVRGRLFTWLYRYWPDYQCTATLTQDCGSGYTQGILELISGNNYQIKKRYSGINNPVTKTIYFPVESTISIEMDGDPVLPSSWIYQGRGIIQFLSPPVSQDLTVSCDFDRAVRFDTDEIFGRFLRDERHKQVNSGQDFLSFYQSTPNDMALYSFESLPLIEVLPPF